MSHHHIYFVGAHSTGKTTLAEALAESYSTAAVVEYARQFVLEKGAAPACRDVGAVARGQIELEDAGAREASRRGATTGIVIQDTDLVSTVIYSHHYYGECPPWIEIFLCLCPRGSVLPRFAPRSVNKPISSD